MQDFYNYLQSFDLTPFEQYALHIWAGLLIAFTSKKHGLIFAVLAGLGKELLDQYMYGGFDVIDMLCTVGGGFLQRRLIKISFTKKD